MVLDERTAQEQLTPEERRGLLRAFADRMLLKITAMDDPEDISGVEKAVRVAAVIERVYSRCDRAERQIRDKTPDPCKAEAERAAHQEEAIKAQVSLANTLKWSDARRQDLGHWWEAAGKAVETPAAPAEKPAERSVASTDKCPAKRLETQQVTYVDYTDGIDALRSDLGLKPVVARPGKIHLPPLRGPPSP